MAFLIFGLSGNAYILLFLGLHVPIQFRFEEHCRPLLLSQLYIYSTSVVGCAFITSIRYAQPFFILSALLDLRTLNRSLS